MQDLSFEAGQVLKMSKIQNKPMFNHAGKSCLEAVGVDMGPDTVKVIFCECGKKDYSTQPPPSYSGSFAQHQSVRSLINISHFPRTLVHLYWMMRLSTDQVVGCPRIRDHLCLQHGV